MIQIDGPRRHVYIKFSDPHRMQEILTATQGQADFRHENREISKVRIEAVGLDMRRVRVTNLPTEVADRTLKMVLGKYGEERDIHAETWSNIYRYPVANRIRVVVMTLVQHIPSHMVVTGHRTLVSYEGQSTACYGCNEPGNLCTACPRRRRTRAVDRKADASWAEVAAKGPTLAHPTTLDRETEITANEQMDTEPLLATDNTHTPSREEICQRGRRTPLPQRRRR